MCPACVTTLALIAAGTGSGGGLTALVVRKLREKKSVKVINPPTSTSGGQNGPPENRVTS